MFAYDITLITAEKYLNPTERNAYNNNVLLEDKLVQDALEAEGLRVLRLNWDAKDFDWSTTKYVLFRAIWDYFERYDEFLSWLERARTQTMFINSIETVKWNIDKHYLLDLAWNGVAIPPTYFIEPGDERSLKKIFDTCGWPKVVLKPAIAGGAFHTYVITPENIVDYEILFKELIAKDSFMLQEFQHQIMSKGEVSLMVFGGQYSHAVLKKGKPGDFRVQDDFGGTLHEYRPSPSEIAFAESCVAACKELPAYARVDVLWDNNDELVLGELELIEPELWFRRHEPAAKLLADSIVKNMT
ncbi:MAG: hypothetical protein KTR13_09935 [Saprospiraceae bacterium]|nr:hypothetical protein [Saprospiraceae bacterium]